MSAVVTSAVAGVGRGRMRSFGGFINMSMSVPSSMLVLKKPYSLLEPAS